MRTVLLTTLLVLSPLAGRAQTADDVVDKYLAARGGVEKIKAVQSERVLGTISFGPEGEGRFLVERLRPLKLHIEITLNRQTFLRVYDGKSSGWTYNPFVPTPSVTPMTEAEIASIFDEADFDGPFVDYKAKGNKLELVGKEEVQGKSAHKLKLTSKRGDTSFFFFDAASGVLLKWEGTRSIGGKEVPWETYFRDFRRVEGLLYPFLIESDAPGSDQTQKILADKIEINVPIEASRFEKPAPPAPPADPEKSQ